MSLIFDGLEPAFRSLRELRKEWTDEKVPEKRKRQHAENVYSYLTIAFKDRFQQSAKEFGYDIGFIFKNEKSFEEGSKEFVRQHPKIGNDFIGLVRNDKLIWLGLMIQVRNDVIDHAAGKDKERVRELEMNLTLERVEVVFDNCWRAIEDIILLFILDKTDDKYGSQLLELSEYRADKDNLERFGWFLIPNHPANRNML